MIPFILGMICGFAFAAFILAIYALTRASGIAHQREEEWGDEKTMDESHE